MRVIAGTAKGRGLARVPPGVRPVSDKVREGLFSSLGDRVEGARVADLYAGTGALGIEALSRGARDAHFVERDPRALAAIGENLDRTGLAPQGIVVRSDVRRYLRRAGTPGFDLVFLDPPYDESVDDALALLAEEPLLRPGFTVVLSRGERSSTDVIPLHWTVARRLSYGDSVITLFRSRNLEV
jgi:16S rRNA (guanine966-N2)-methyltransferase